MLWMLNDIIWSAFQKGSDAWERHLKQKKKIRNPYKKETNEWYSWNKGWSTNFNGI